MTIHPAHRRLAELWTFGQKRELSPEERTEMEHCLRANAKLCWDMACLENASLLASMVGDTDWQHDICQKIEALPWQAKKPEEPEPGTGEAAR